MVGFDKLLVAVDGSDSSAHALRECLRLAREQRSLVLAVSVVPRYEGDLRLVGVRDIKAVLREPCEKALSEAGKVAKAEGSPVRTMCVEGEPHEEIVDLAEAEGCDLIVMGRGESPLDRFRTGRITARVIGYSQRDVLVVPKEAPIRWQRLLAATDGSKFGALATRRALELAKVFGAKLDIIAATDFACELYAEAPEVGEELIRKAKGHLEAGRQEADRVGVQTECFVREGFAYQAILDFAKENGTQMIIMGSHGRTGIKRLLMGSAAEKVISHSSCPVLIVKTWPESHGWSEETLARWSVGKTSYGHI